MSELKDPLNNRVVKTSSLPYQTSLTEEQVFKGTGVDWSLIRDFFKREGKLQKDILMSLIDKAKIMLSTSIFILEDEPNMI